MKNVLLNIESEPGKSKLYSKNAQQLLLLYLHIIYKTLCVLWAYFKHSSNTQVFITFKRPNLL